MRLFRIFFAGWLLLSAGSAHAQSLVLATYQYADNNRLHHIRPLAEHLARTTGQPVEVKSYPTVQAFITALQGDEVDIALINTFGYLLLEASARPHALKPCAVLQVRPGARDNYKTAIIAHNGITASTLAGLRQEAASLRLLLVSPGSTSGNLVPRLALNGAGISDPETGFRSLGYAGNHRAAAEAVLNGSADVAAVGSTEYFRLLADTALAAKIRLLWLSPEIPLGPVLLHQRLRPALRDSIVQELILLHQTNAPALESVKKGWSEAAQADRYIRMDAGYYTPFRRTLGDAGHLEAILKRFAQ
ncbi:MAG TPA: PhnD/SsuA/transferrin family substrate-binding protein [Chitinophagaceae bacterium]|jgi:phosphate/phosphite/phosphonate ABC transporter binding protein|nr:PhnD/SsuA/transferrin family substrate-binding protein [Chitinophagaceae bacterium]